MKHIEITNMLTSVKQIFFFRFSVMIFKFLIYIWIYNVGVNNKLFAQFFSVELNIIIFAILLNLSSFC